MRISLIISVFIVLIQAPSCTQPASAGEREQEQPQQQSQRPQQPQPKRPQPVGNYASYQPLFERYDRYKETTIRQRRFKNADIVPLLQKLGAPFQVMEAGRSIENRPIYRVQAGQGPVKVLLWSQMHGDESTATMALFDIFRFLSANDEFNDLRQRLLSNLTIVALPMLNPDGAERYSRRNALGIDLNRDALRLQCPESQLLKQTRDDLDADWGFNLHDQGRYYAAGKKPKTATMSFLAPAYNEAKEINDVRGNAMQLIGWMNGLVQAYLPGQVGRYDDEFEPRAFGDNIQKWGTSTILIECGGMPNDPEKQYIRKVHFVLLLAALDAIAQKEYENTDLAAYEQIPFNESNSFHDLILREVEIDFKGESYLVDVAFQRREVAVDKNRDYYYRAEISEFGDLSVFFAYDDFDGRGYRAVPGKTYSRTLGNADEIKSLDALDLLRQGYTSIRLRDLPDRTKMDYFPFKLLAPDKSDDTRIAIGNNTSLLLKKGDRVEAVVVNGFLFDLKKDAEVIRKLINKI
ncbi:MAG: peptidase M14 [Saprospiraceae bacterium]|nr:peptidase M14 [Saprospiraceae bacterium]